MNVSPENIWISFWLKVICDCSMRMKLILSIEEVIRRQPNRVLIGLKLVIRINTTKTLNISKRCRRNEIVCDWCDIECDGKTVNDHNSCDWFIIIHLYFIFPTSEVSYLIFHTKFNIIFASSERNKKKMVRWLHIADGRQSTFYSRWRQAGGLCFPQPQSFVSHFGEPGWVT